MRVEASVAVDVAARRVRSSASASGGEEDVTTGIWHDEGEPGVEAGSEEATCRQRTMKESVKMLQTEEKTKECDSGGELGDMGVVAGGGAESQDQEVRAQRGRRELGEEERRHRRGTCVSCCRNHLLTRTNFIREKLRTLSPPPSSAPCEAGEATTCTLSDADVSGVTRRPSVACSAST